MTRETQWQEEWAALRAERDGARRRVRAAVDGLAAKARDPLGLRAFVRGHPLAAGGIGAAVGALLVKTLVGRARRASGDAAARPASAWSSMLREAAIGVAAPWLVRTLKEKFGWDVDPRAAPERAGPPPTADDAAHAAGPARSGT